MQLCSVGGGMKTELIVFCSLLQSALYGHSMKDSFFLPVPGYFFDFNGD